MTSITVTNKKTSKTTSKTTKKRTSQKTDKKTGKKKGRKTDKKAKKGAKKGEQKRPPKRAPRPRTEETPAKRPPARHGPKLVHGRVLPIELGQDGVRVRVTRSGPLLILPAGVPGDGVKVRIGPHGRAALDQVPEPAPERVVAPCPLLHSCGGCSLQAMDYGAQLAAKTTALRAALEAIGGVESAEVPPVVGLPSSFGFRTKLLMVTDSAATSQLRLGFHRRGSARTVVPAEGCPVQHPLALAVLASTRQLLESAGVRPSTVQDRSQGWLHAVGLRVDPTTERSELTLSARTPNVSRGDALVLPLSRIPSVRAVHVCAAQRGSSYPLDGRLSRLAGSRRVPFVVGGERFHLGPGTFFQTSALGAELLVEQVLELLPDRIRLLADLYAGVGLFSVLSASRWDKAVAVESNPSAVADLHHRLEHAPLGGLTVLEERVERCIEQVLASGPDVVLLDPPRAGCKSAVIDALLAAPPPTVLYVSCGFEAFDRDARRLVASGYHVAAVRGVDLFPHTAHLELVVRFER